MTDRIKPFVRIDQWVRSMDWGYPHLVGRVTGHPVIEDGHMAHSSTIMQDYEITNASGLGASDHIVETLNTRYILGEPAKNDRYLKQVIVVRKDLSMPQGKLAAMVAHAAMTFIVRRLSQIDRTNEIRVPAGGVFSNDEWQWMTEPEPGVPGQVSFAKIVCAVDSEEELQELAFKAKEAGLQCHSVIDGGYSHNKKGDFVAVAIGPAWPEQLEPVTGGLKLYR